MAAQPLGSVDVSYGGYESVDGLTDEQMVARLRIQVSTGGICPIFLSETPKILTRVGRMSILAILAAVRWYTWARHQRSVAERRTDMMLLGGSIGGSSLCWMKSSAWMEIRAWPTIGRENHWSIFCRHLEAAAAEHEKQEEEDAADAMEAVAAARVLATARTVRAAAAGPSNAGPPAVDVEDIGSLSDSESSSDGTAAGDAMPEPSRNIITVEPGSPVVTGDNVMSTAKRHHASE